MAADRTVRALLFFFGLVYFAQGLAGGLLVQPLTASLKAQGLATDAASRSLALLATPWMIKPLFGLLADFVPPFAARRRRFIVVMTGVAALGYALLAGTALPEMHLGLLLLATIGVAATDVGVDALMVQQGHRTGCLGRFQARQWTCLNAAAVAAGFAGGWLTHYAAPSQAIRLAALVLVGTSAAVMLAAIYCIEESGEPPDTAPVRAAAAVGAGVRSRALWAVAALLVLWNVTPRFTTPLYYHMTDTLRIDQAMLGELNALGAVGAACGAWLYGRYVARRLSPVQLIPVCTILTVGLTLAHLGLVDVRAAVVLAVVGGVVSVFPLLMLFHLAAAVCPPQAAGFTFAVLMSLYSGAGQIGSVAGAHLYETFFEQQLAPLIWTAAGVSLLAMAAAPVLRRLGVAHP